jgi:hypothetical protein
VIEVVKQYGFLKVLDDRDLVVEFDAKEDLEKLEKDLLDNFQGQVNLEPIK